MHIVIGVFLMASAIAMPALGEDAPLSCQAEQHMIGQLEAKYKPQYDDLEKEGKSLQKDAPSEKIDMDFKVEIKEQRWRFYLPSLTMTRNAIAIGVPQVTMKHQKWSYDVPTVRMERRKIGQHPETTCSKDDVGIPYDCRTVWKNNYIDVPVTVMLTQGIELDVPEFKWSDVRLSWDIPRLTWVENTWKVKIPEFTLVDVNIQKGKKLKDKGESIRTKGNQITAARNLDAKAATTALYGCVRNDLNKQQGLVERQMNDGIASLQSTIQSIRAQGADPTKVPGTGDKAINLEETLADLIKKRGEAIDSFKKAAQDIDDSEKMAFAQLESPLESMLQPS